MQSFIWNCFKLHLVTIPNYLVGRRWQREGRNNLHYIGKTRDDSHRLHGEIYYLFFFLYPARE